MNDQTVETSETRSHWVVVWSFLLLGVWVVLALLAPLRVHGVEIILTWMGLFFLFTINLIAALVLLNRKNRKP